MGDSITRFVLKLTAENKTYAFTFRCRLLIPQELKTHEEDEYMKYFYDTLSKLRTARDKASQRVREEESRLELYSQKDEGAIKLAAALRFNEHLMSLTMCDSEIGPVGATALAAAIKVHPALTHLSLKHNPLLAEGAEAIFRATRRNGVCGLAELDLYDCGIGPEGATMLAAQLYKNGTLEDLRLRYNQMGPEGATAIASMLMENRTILDLDMVLNSVQMTGALAFERVLKSTVIAEVDKGDDISKLKSILSQAKKKITDPFWDDLKEPSFGIDSNAKNSHGSSEDEDSDRGREGDTEVGESEREGSQEPEDETAGDIFDEEEGEKDADDSATKDTEDSGGGESKTKSVKKPKKL